MPATDADIPRARSVQSRPAHAEHCWCSLRLAVLPVTGEDAEMRGGAGRAQRRLSEERVGWVCSAACRRRRRAAGGTSDTLIQVWIQHGVDVHLQHVSELRTSAVSPRTSLHIGFSRSPHSVTSTECGDRESEVTGMNPGPRERRAVRATAPTEKMNLL